MPDFDAFFAAEMETETVPFSVKGQPCSLTLRMMEDADHLRFQMMAAKVSGDEEALKASRFLVARTLHDWVIRFPKTARTGEEVVEEMRAPETASERRARIEAGLKLTPKVWNWIVDQCLRVNGFAGDDPKNSTDS